MEAPFRKLRQALEAAAIARRPAGRCEPARARTTPRDGSEVPHERGMVTFPATVTQYPTPTEGTPE